MFSRILSALSTRSYELMQLIVVVVLAVSVLYCYSFSDSRMVLAFGSLSIVAAVCFYVVIHLLNSKGKLKPETLLLIALLVCGVAYLVVFTPGSVPDEAYHYKASYKLADALLFLNPTTNNLPMREADVALLQMMEGNAFLDYENYDSLIRGFSLFTSQTSLVDYFPNSYLDWAANPPYVKLPSALGIMIGIGLNLGSYPTFYLGRFFNFLLFVFLAYQAVRITPVGKNVLMAVCLLPMTMHITASYSYDAGVLGLSFLLTALLLKALYGQDQLSRKHQVIIVLIAAMLTPLKVIYVAIALAAFLIPSTKFASKAEGTCFKVILFASVALVLVVLRLPTLLTMLGFITPEPLASPDQIEALVSSGADVRGTDAAVYYSFASIIADPLDAILMFVRTLDAYGSRYTETMVGISLGWFQADIGAPQIYELFLYFILILAALRSKDDDCVILPKHRLVFGMIFPLIVFAVMLALYLSFTLVGETVIQGVQGRYFLPVLPLLLLACRSKHASIFVCTGTVIVSLLVAFNLMYAVRILALAVGIPDAAMLPS